MNITQFLKNTKCKCKKCNKMLRVSSILFINKIAYISERFNDDREEDFYKIVYGGNNKKIVLDFEKRQLNNKVKSSIIEILEYISKKNITIRFYCNDDEIRHQYSFQFIFDLDNGDIVNDKLLNFVIAINNSNEEKFNFSISQECTYINEEKINLKIKEKYLMDLDLLKRKIESLCILK